MAKQLRIKLYINPLGAIIKKVNSSVFCPKTSGVKRNKTSRYASLLQVTCIENRF